MSQCPDLGTKAQTRCSCGGQPRRVLVTQVSVRVSQTAFPVLQYAHLKGCENHNGHPQITSQRHLREVCAMNDLRIERGVDV
jgi:hypothetical protein